MGKQIYLEQVGLQTILILKIIYHFFTVKTLLLMVLITHISKNENFDNLYESTFLETNDSIRNEIYKKLDKIIIDEAPIVVLL